MGQAPEVKIPALIVGAGEDIKTGSQFLTKMFAEYGLEVKHRWGLPEAEARTPIPAGVEVCVLLVDYGDPSLGIKWLRETCRTQKVTFVASQRKPPALARAMALVGIRTLAGGENVQIPLISESPTNTASPFEGASEESVMAAVPPIVRPVSVSPASPPSIPPFYTADTSLTVEENIERLKVILRMLKAQGVDSVIYTSDGLEISRRQTLKMDI